MLQKEFNISNKFESKSFYEYPGYDTEILLNISNLSLNILNRPKSEERKCYHLQQALIRHIFSIKKRSEEMLKSKVLKKALFEKPNNWKNTNQRNKIEDFSNYAKNVSVKKYTEMRWMRVQTHHPEVFLAGIITPGYNSKRIYNGLTNTKKSMRKIYKS